jgi:hypothetical protein
MMNPGDHVREVDELRRGRYIPHLGFVGCEVDGESGVGERWVVDECVAVEVDEEMAVPIYVGWVVGAKNLGDKLTFRWGQA